MPISIQLSEVCMKYPVTLAQRLFSAVPRREFSLNSIDLLLDEPQIRLLTGDSSAGKSTVLRLVAGLEQPTSGSVELSVLNNPISNGEEMTVAPHAVLLDAAADIPKYDYYTASNISPSDLVAKVLPRAGKQTTSLARLEGLAERLIPILMPQSHNKAEERSSSQSQMYQMRLLEAALESMVKSSEFKTTTMHYPSPLLLLDEWLDRETSNVIQTVQASLEKLVSDTGAIVLVVTHKPERWSIDHDTTKRTVLSLGRIVSHTQMER